MTDHWIPGHDGVPRQEQPLSYPLDERDRFVTPDGVALSGWWRRWLAYVVDGFLVAAVTSLLLLPAQLAEPNIAVGVSTPTGIVDSWDAPFTAPWWYALATAGVTLVVGALYSVLMLTRLGWTLGKRLMGIRVRHRDHERLPTVAEALRRWGVQLAPVALGPVPYLGAAAGLWTMLDGLWPIWDVRRQAIHDRMAGTSVVRAR